MSQSKILIVLMIVMIGGGVYLFFNKYSKPTTPSNKQDKSTRIVKTPPPVQSHDLSSYNSTSSGLPKAPHVTSGKEMDDYIAEVKRLAKTISEIEVNQCQLNPSVVKVIPGSQLTFKNKGKEDVFIFVGTKDQFSIAPAKDYKYSLGANLRGIYQLNCQINTTRYQRVGLLYSP